MAGFMIFQVVFPGISDHCLGNIQEADGANRHTPTKSYNVQKEPA